MVFRRERVSSCRALQHLLALFAPKSSPRAHFIVSVLVLVTSGRARFPIDVRRILFMTVTPHATMQTSDSTVDAATHPAHVFKQFQLSTAALDQDL